MVFDKNIPKAEYPRPQMVRTEWINLNGEWEFEIDHGNSGKERRLFEADTLKDRIVVPFCPESKLSGIEYKDFMEAVWYRRKVTIPEEWKSKRILLHFGAVDYKAEVWINGVSAGTHRGGYTPFTFDITGLLKPGDNVIAAHAEDNIRSRLQAAGKQSGGYYSHGCYYTRTTGIWQTVWMECVPACCIAGLKYMADPDNSCLFVDVDFSGNAGRCRVEAKACFEGRPVGSSFTVVTGNNARLAVILSELHLWGPGVPNLYDLEISLCNENKTIDRVYSYFGMRSISLCDGKVLLNGEKVFQRLVLDQGFYPDGIYTAPDEEALKLDIELAMGLGFNGARLHQKVFEPRYLYWADRMGYLVWGEYGNWGLDITGPMGLERFLPEWLEAVKRDMNHPSIIVWCPFNETWDSDGKKQDGEVLENVYRFTKILDKTRPVIDTSGNYHVVTDIFDIHEYEQDPAKFADFFEPMKNGENVYVTFDDRQKYNGQPYFVSEYGGIWWKPGNEKGWGYGERPHDEGEFLERYRCLTETLLGNPKICGFCYTQLYDVEQEVNGLYSYERKAKFDPGTIKRINIQKAAFEKNSG